MKDRSKWQEKRLMLSAVMLAKILGKFTEGTANYGCVFYDDDQHGRDLHIYQNTACHSELRVRNNNLQALNPDMIVSAIWNHPGNDGLIYAKWFIELGKRYYKFLINDSIYAPIFKCKSLSRLMEQRAFIIDTHTPDLLLFGGLCATRAMWEHTDAIIIWDYLVKNGINPSIALVLCKSLGTLNRLPTKCVKKAYETGADLPKSRTIEVILGCTEHWPLPTSYFDVRKLKKYSGTFEDVKSLYKHCLTYYESSTYGNCNSMFETVIQEYRIKNVLGKLLYKMKESKSKEIKKITEYKDWNDSCITATLTGKGAIILAEDLTKLANKLSGEK